jgi:hypothetical protein
MRNLVNEYAEQMFDSTIDAVSVKYLKYTPFDQQMPFFENSYELTRFHNCKNQLINLTNLKVHDMQTTEYIKNVWYPSVAKLGVVKIAVIIPSTAVGKISTRTANESSQNFEGLLVCTFGVEKEAREWLMTNS